MGATATRQHIFILAHILNSYIHSYYIINIINVTLLCIIISIYVLIINNNKNFVHLQCYIIVRLTSVRARAHSHKHKLVVKREKVATSPSVRCESITGPCLSFALSAFLLSTFHSLHHYNNMSMI